MPVSVNYVKVVKSSIKFIYTPDLDYKSVQAVDAELLRLNDNDVFNEFMESGIDLQLFKKIFDELLNDPHKTDNWRTVDEPLYFNQESLLNRLKGEGRGNEEIKFYMLQVYKLQASILERIDAIRKIFDDLSAADDGVNRINEEELKKYFTTQFFGGGMSSNKWSLDYLPSLRKQRTTIDYARIALMTYGSKYINKRYKPTTFDEFYRIFCDAVGCQYNKNYKPSKLQATKELTIEFAYL